MEILKNFAVLEGGDGSGTTTQLKILETHYGEEAKKMALPPLYTTFEPTDSIIGTIIRRALKNEEKIDKITLAHLFAADRSQHLYGPGGIVEHLDRGGLVVSDRYLPSSLVYQGITVGEELCKRLNEGFPGPELLFFLDLDPSIAQKRMENRSEKEIYEYLDFQVQVRERYVALMPYFQAQGVRVEIIDAQQSPEEIAALIWEKLQGLDALSCR
ncbi:MAG: dTMP kinase [Treponema sp.]|nr:dTMP kinase [Treponema sp.]